MGSNYLDGFNDVIVNSGVNLVLQIMLRLAVLVEDDVIDLAVTVILEVAMTLARVARYGGKVLVISYANEARGAVDFVV
jgi:hypothetical protein